MSSLHAQLLGDEGVFRELDDPSPVLVIAFGGLRMLFGGSPPFEFFRVLGDQAPAKKLFLRDHRRAWYHRGVRGCADDIPGVEVALRRMIAEAGASKTVMLGSSAGGYAALLFGRLLGVTEVHAFGPQTFLSPDLRRLHDDQRFEERLSALMSSGCFRDEYGDLKDVFSRTSAPHTRFVVHYGEGDALDVIHAEHLQPEENLELRAYEGVDHNVAGSLRDSDQLQSVVHEMIAF